MLNGSHMDVCRIHDLTVVHLFKCIFNLGPRAALIRHCLQPAVITFLKTMEKRKELCKRLRADCKKQLTRTSRCLLIVRLTCSMDGPLPSFRWEGNCGPAFRQGPEVLCPEWRYLKQFQEADARIKKRQNRTLTDCPTSVHRRRPGNPTEPPRYYCDSLWWRSSAAWRRRTCPCCSRWWCSIYTLWPGSKSAGSIKFIN